MMLSLVLRRLVALVAVLFGLMLIVFLLQAVVPQNPARAMVGASAPPQAVAQKSHELGYDQPLPVRFVDYVTRVLNGDLQTSLRTRNPVAKDLETFAPATLELALMTAAFAAVMGIGLGLALAAGGRVARHLRLVLIGGASIPAFLTGLLLIILFYSTLHLLPASGRISDTLSPPNGPTGLFLVDSVLNGEPEVFWSALTHIILPALTLSLIPALAIARTLATSCEQVMREDYVRTARTKGLGERRIVARHVLRNACGPALTMSGLQFGLLLGGIVVVEQIFAWPGLGRYIDQSIAYSDFPAIMGTTLLLGTTYVVVNFLVDLAQAWADPRIRTV
jgi:peptide/nickel transport system permease protein